MFAILKSKYIRCLIGIFVFTFVSFVTYNSYASVCFLPTGDCGGDDVSADTNDDLPFWCEEDDTDPRCKNNSNDSIGCTGSNCNNSDDTETKCTTSCTKEEGHRTCTTDSNGCSIVAKECSGNTYLTQAYCTSANSGKTCTQSGSCWVVDNTNDEGNSPIDYCIETSGYYDTQAACTSANNGQNWSESNGCWIVDTSDSACEGYDVAKSTLVTLQDAYDVANFDDFVDNLQKYTLESCTVCPTDSTKYKCEYVGCPNGKTLYVYSETARNNISTLLSNTTLSNYDIFVHKNDMMKYENDEDTENFVFSQQIQRSLTSGEVDDCCYLVNISSETHEICDYVDNSEGCATKSIDDSSGKSVGEEDNIEAFVYNPYGYNDENNVVHCEIKFSCKVKNTDGKILGSVDVYNYQGDWCFSEIFAVRQM